MGISVSDLTLKTGVFEVFGEGMFGEMIQLAMDEKSLLKSLQEGDTKVFELLVRLHYQALYHVVFRFMQDHGRTDDVVQESFVKAYRSIHTFRGDSSFKSWVMRIAINTAKNALRASDHRPTLDIQELQIAVHHRDFLNLERGETAELLKLAIEKLPARQRQALELRIYEDMSFKDIALAMNSPFDTAKANFRHAVLNLRKVLEASGEGKDLMELELAFRALGEENHETL